MLEWLETGYSFLAKWLSRRKSKIRTLEEKVARQSEELRKRDEVFYARNAVWKKDETAFLAYCPPCHASKNQLIPLKRCRDNSGRCQICKSNYDCVYDGPRPKEGDDATAVRTESRGETIARASRSRRDEFRI